MPSRLTTALALLIPLLLPVCAQAQLATLGVVVAGLEPPAGKVEVSLFTSEQDFMKKPFLQQTQEAAGAHELRFEFAGLTEGEYGVVVVHDENDNGVYDAGFLGFGGEGVGYSNDAAPLLGRPSFEAVRFGIGSSDVEILIRLD
jgi:uncharacterized protein (DUF2141 family)